MAETSGLDDLLNQELCGFEQRLSCLQPLLKQPLDRRGMVCEAID